MEVKPFETKRDGFTGFFNKSYEMPFPPDFHPKIAFNFRLEFATPTCFADELTVNESKHAIRNYRCYQFDVETGLPEDVTDSVVEYIKVE